MSDWGWVALGYGVFYGAIVLYVAGLVARTRRARARLEGRQ